MRACRVAIALMLLAVLSACGTAKVGRDFALAAFESGVQRGTTTQLQVRGWLGAPAGVGVSVDTGGTLYDEWTYFYGEGQIPDAANARLKILQIKFDQQGVVRGYNWSDERN